MKISVVIPAYNEEQNITKCLKCIYNQTILPDEVIVVDNNSTDKTVQLAKEFPVQIERETTQGIIPARNHGFDSARYDVIARTDADTDLPSNWLEKIKNTFTNKHCDAVLGSVYYKNTTAVFNKIVFEGFAEFLKLLFGEYPLIGPNMAISKHIWKKVRSSVCLDDHKVHEDIDLAIHIGRLGGKVFFDRKNIVRTSQRRLVHNPSSFFIEYPQRLMKMKLAHLA